MTNFFEEAENAKLNLESFGLNAEDVAKFKEMTDANIARSEAKFKEMTDASIARSEAEFKEVSDASLARFEAFLSCVDSAHDSYLDNIRAVCGNDTLVLDCPIAGDFSNYHANLDACLKIY